MNQEDNKPDSTVPQSEPVVEQKEAPRAEDATLKDATPPSAAPIPPVPTGADSPASAEKSEPEEEPFDCEDAGTENSERMKKLIVGVLKTVFDPEIPVNIYALGMVYNVAVDEDNRSLVTMTLTSPSCPVAGTLPGEVEQKVKDAPGVSDAKVIIVWDPPWTPDMMSEAAKLELNMM